jgi:branched-chain amino acid transport system substrate-binding protein
MERMRATPINDFMTKNGTLPIDGTVERDMFLLQAKTPAQSNSQWDLLEVAEVIPGKQAFRPMEQGGCAIARARAKDSHTRIQIST